MGGQARGRLVVISGPSGVGKTTVVRRLALRPGTERVVTATTRSPRKGEVPGRDYHFLSREEFLAGIEAGRFLEHATVHGNLYGTLRDEVESALGRGTTCLLSIDVVGAATVLKAMPTALTLFLAPPDFETLVRRLSGRGTEDAGEMERRLAVAREELAKKDEFDVVVVNDDLDRTVEKVAEIIEERRQETGGDRP